MLFIWIKKQRLGLGGRFVFNAINILVNSAPAAASTTLPLQQTVRGFLIHVVIQIERMKYSCGFTFTISWAPTLHHTAG